MGNIVCPFCGSDDVIECVDGELMCMSCKMYFEEYDCNGIEFDDELDGLFLSDYPNDDEDEEIDVFEYMKHTEDDL